MSYCAMGLMESEILPSVLGKTLKLLRALSAAASLKCRTPGTRPNHKLFNTLHDQSGFDIIAFFYEPLFCFFD